MSDPNGQPSLQAYNAGLMEAVTIALITMSRNKGSVPMIEILRLGIAVADAIHARMKEKPL